MLRLRIALSGRMMEGKSRSGNGNRAQSSSLGSGDPELHSHTAEHLDRMPSRLEGLVRSPLGIVKDGQAEMAASFKRSHLELPGQRQRLAKAFVSLTGRSGLPRGGYAGLEVQRPRLVPALAALPRLLEGLVGHRGRFVRLSCEEQRLAQRGEPPRVPTHVSQSFGLIDSSAQDGQPLGWSPGKGVGIAEGCREPWTVDRELPTPTHRETAREGGRGLPEPSPIEIGTADGREGAGERERTIDPPRELQCTLGRGERLLEPSQFRQRRGDVIEAE